MASDIAMNDRAVERHDAAIVDEPLGCERCGGSGVCDECAGQGFVPTGVGTGTCDRCQGSGCCETCGGEGVQA